MHNEMLCTSINLSYILSIDYNYILKIITNVIENNPDAPYYASTSFDQTGKIIKVFLFPKETLKLVISEIIDRQEKESISLCTNQETSMLFEKHGY